MRSTDRAAARPCPPKSAAVAHEFSLIRAELSECGSLIATSLTALVVGLVLLLAGLGLILVALSLLLVRFGVPLDLAFLIVALAVIATALLFVGREYGV